MGSGQLEVRPWQDTYIRGDRFDQDAMLALLEELLQSGPAAGYPLMRLLGHMEWALPRHARLSTTWWNMRHASITCFPSTTIR